MPFATFAAPSLGISLLQAGLRRAGFSCDIHYLNLPFAARVGCMSYLKLGIDSSTAFAGEWLFAEEVFGTNRQRDRTYIEKVLKRRYHFPPSKLRRVMEVRRCVRRYLDECLERLPWDQYDVVGFSSTFQQNLASLALAKRLKEAFPQKKIVFGGANCEGEMGIELHRQFSFIDFVCSGEGDQAFPELVRRLAAGNETGEIAGIVSRVGRETVVPREIVSPIFDMDALPYPSFDDYFEQLRRHAHSLTHRLRPVVPYETSRGCWWGAKMHCTFCGLNGNAMAYRSKTPARALDELISLRKYGSEIIATDNIVDLKYLDSFFPQLASQKLPFKFSLIETKVNLTKEQLRSLRSAGAIRLQPGIESLSTPVLKRMKKGCNLLQNVQFLRWSKQMGIDVAWNILYGFPGESPAEYLEMARIIPLLRHLDPPSGCGKIRVDRFSPYFARPAEYGITNVRPFEAYRYIYPFEPDVLERLAYHFEFDAPEAPPVEEYVRPLVKKVKVWRSARRRGNLKGTIRQETLLLVDTRKRKKLITVLQEPLRSCYIFCDQARAFSTILAHVSARCPSPVVSGAWLEGALDDLVSRGLMLKDGKSYLSLAILPLPSAPSAAVEREVSYAAVQAEVRIEGLVQLGASEQPTV